MTTRLTDRDIDEIARRIAADISRGTVTLPQFVPSGAASPVQAGLGVFPTVDEAVAAARAAQPQFAALKLEHRARIIAAVRKTMLENAELLAKAAHDETGYGRYEDKVVKNRLVTEKTPGIEELYPGVVTGDHGLTLTEPAPFGTIAAITPTTNPTSTIICNTIGMIAAGNTVVYNVHPYSTNCCM